MNFLYVVILHLIVTSKALGSNGEAQNIAIPDNLYEASLTAIAQQFVVVKQKETKKKHKGKPDAGTAAESSVVASV